MDPGVGWSRGVLSAARRVRQPQHRGREQHPGEPGDHERRTPAEVRAHLAPDDVAERRTDGNGHVEHRVHAAATVGCETVGEQRRRDGDVRRFADADQRAPGEQLRIVTGKPREERRQTPHEHAERDRPGARAAIAPGAEHGRGDHVHQHERRYQQAELGIRKAHRAFQIRRDRRHDVAVEIVEQVDRGEDAERPEGSWRRCGGAQVRRLALTWPAVRLYRQRGRGREIFRSLRRAAADSSSAPASAARGTGAPDRESPRCWSRWCRPRRPG